MISDPEKMESWFRHYFKKIEPKALDKIEESEMVALAIIGDHGYKFQKPYNYFDKYVTDGTRYYYLDGSEYKTWRELAESTPTADYNTWCSLPELIRRFEKKPTWEREPLFIAASILEYCYEARPRMDGGYTEYTQDKAMLLQREIERLDNREFKEAALKGEAKVKWGGELGRANLGKETPFTEYVREVISISAGEARGDLTTEDVLNNFKYCKTDEVEVISIDKSKLCYYENDKPKKISIKKLKEKISKLKK